MLSLHFTGSLAIGNRDSCLFVHKGLHAFVQSLSNVTNMAPTADGIARAVGLGLYSQEYHSTTAMITCVEPGKTLLSKGRPYTTTLY